MTLAFQEIRVVCFAPFSEHLTFLLRTEAEIQHRRSDRCCLAFLPRSSSDLPLICTMDVKVRFTAVMIIQLCLEIRVLSRLSSSPCPPYYSRPLHTSYSFHPPLHRCREMAEMTRRRIHGIGDSLSADKAKSPTGAVAEREHHDHGLSNTRPHTHTHSLGIFGRHTHSHLHGHGHDGHDHGGGLIETLHSGGTR